MGNVLKDPLHPDRSVEITASRELKVSGSGGGSSTPTTIYNNHVNVTTAGTRVQLTSTSTTIQKVTIKANDGNVGNIFVGDSNVDSTNGIVLNTGESVDIMIDDLSKVYIDSETNGDGISYVGG